MRRTNAGTRGRRFAAALLAAGVVAGLAASPAAAVDSIRDQQWHLDSMKAPDMWQTSKGAGVTVAVIDSGVKLDHPDLVGQLLPGKDFSGLSGGVGDDKIGHGTGIAGIIAATGKGLGGKGAVGLAPEARILPVKTQNNANSVAGISNSDFLKQIDQAIIYAADQGAKVINISQGGSGFSDADIAELRAAVAHAASKGALVVAAAGNEAQSGNPVEYPAALPTVVAVGAVDRNGVVTDESERGSQLDLAAPGVDIYRPCTGSSGYCKSHGSSDAAALVSASAALLWSVHPDWSANQILRVLINTAGKPSDGSARSDALGYGIVRPRIALTTPGDPGPANVSPLADDASSTPTGAASGPAQTTATPQSPAASAPATGDAPVTVPNHDAENKKSGSNTLLIVGGSVVGLAVLIGVVVAVVISRRRSAAPAAPAAPGAGPVPVGAPPAYPAPSQPQYGQQFGQQYPPQPGAGAPPQYGRPPHQSQPQQPAPDAPTQSARPGTPPPSYGPPGNPPQHNPYNQ
ncbi:type VII secretion-associated serine protease mycosin [Kitasatospora sp. NBC_00315]|uniref:type VII secretion-associated serine protease mycosin n=1 Tax=Kitasatospora sp. NBC_00315 TaxID=2975963 RepID=UPI00324E0E97